MTLPIFTPDKMTNVDINSICDGPMWAQALFDEAGCPQKFTALDATEAYLRLLDNEDISNPCAEGFLKALCGMITPQIASDIAAQAGEPNLTFRSGKRFFIWVMRHLGGQGDPEDQYLDFSLSRWTIDDFIEECVYPALVAHADE